MTATLIDLRTRSMRPACPRDARDASDGELQRKADLCASVLTEARRQISAANFGAILSQLLARAGDLQDEIDEILVSLDPRDDHEAFARVAALHRNLEEIQSRLPPKYRSLVRGSRLA